MIAGEDARLLDRLERAVRATRPRGRPGLLSLTVEIPPLEDPLALAAAATDLEHHAFLWQRPAEGLTLVGIGAARVLEADGSGRFHALSAAASALFAETVVEAPDAPGRPPPTLVGGLAFAPRAARDPAWADFPDARLVLPRLLLRQHGRSARLTLNHVCGGGDGAGVELLGGLLRRAGAHAAAAPPPAAYAISASRSRQDWLDAVAACLAGIRAGALAKVVLARACTVRADAPFDPPRLVRRLRGGFPDCAIFWVRCGAASFVGATPESLVAVDRGAVRTAAVAGSAPRGSTPGHDAELARRLLSSAKERSEHALVVDAIRDALAAACDDLDVAPEPELLRLENVQHLITRIRGRCREGRGVLDLAARLHPSPAVAGQPRAAAVRAIAEHERLDRGWYAGPIGWLDAGGNGELAVAIRSALLCGNEARLYAGAGIVAESDPEAELQETRWKMQPVLAGLVEV